MDNVGGCCVGDLSFSDSARTHFVALQSTKTTLGGTPVTPSVICPEVQPTQEGLISIYQMALKTHFPGSTGRKVFFLPGVHVKAMQPLTEGHTNQSWQGSAKNSC